MVFGKQIAMSYQSFKSGSSEKKNKQKTKQNKTCECPQFKRVKISIDHQIVLVDYLDIFSFHLFRVQFWPERNETAIL